MADELTPAQQRQLDYEQLHPTEFGCSGLNTFTIIGMFLITFALGMRFLSRKLAKIPFKADDYLLALALVIPHSSSHFTQPFDLAPSLDSISIQLTSSSVGTYNWRSGNGRQQCSERALVPPPVYPNPC